MVSGTANEEESMPEDVNGDGVIDVGDLLAVVGSDVCVAYQSMLHT